MFGAENAIYCWVSIMLNITAMSFSAPSSVPYVTIATVTIASFKPIYYAFTERFLRTASI
jgi:hypothetical protein